MMRYVPGWAAWLLSCAALFLYPMGGGAQIAPPSVCDRPVDRLAQVVCPDGELSALYALIENAHQFDLDSPRTLSVADLRAEQAAWENLTRQVCDLIGLRPVQPPQRARLARCARRQFSARLATLGARLPTASYRQPVPPTLIPLLFSDQARFDFVAAFRNPQVFADETTLGAQTPAYIRLSPNLISGPGIACALAGLDRLELSVARAIPLLTRADLSDFPDLPLDGEDPITLLLFACQHGALNQSGTMAIKVQGDQLIYANGPHLLLFARR